MREHRPEKFTLKGFTCPECNGNGFGWCQVAGGDGWGRRACRICGGSGEVAAEVTVSWKKSF